MATNRRTHVVLSDELVQEIDRVVGARQRSSFLAQAAERELTRLRQLQALDALVPWSEKDHPELKQGASQWVSKLRQENERRVNQATGR